MNKAQHSSDSSVFGPRAYFRTSFPNPAVLVIEDIKRHDAATYRCRVDFRKGQTRSFRYNLTVIGESAAVRIFHRTERVSRIKGRERDSPRRVPRRRRV